MTLMEWPVFPAKYYTSADPPGCSCPQWKYRPWARPCKHVSALLAAIDLLEAQNLKNRGAQGCQLSTTGPESRTGPEAVI